MKYTNDTRLIVFICCLLQGECKSVQCHSLGGFLGVSVIFPSISSSMPARVDTLPVNKKQIVTARQSHLWRFNTQTHICNIVCVSVAQQPNSPQPKKRHNRPLIPV